MRSTESRYFRISVDRTSRSLPQLKKLSEKRKCFFFFFFSFNKIQNFLKRVSENKTEKRIVRDDMKHDKILEVGSRTSQNPFNTTWDLYYTTFYGRNKIVWSLSRINSCRSSSICGKAGDF